MSPILKRDFSEQFRQAKRLAAAATGHTKTIFDANDDDDGLLRDPHQHHDGRSGDDYAGHAGFASASASSARQGIGVDPKTLEGDYQPVHWHSTVPEYVYDQGGGSKSKSKGKGRARDDHRHYPNDVDEVHGGIDLKDEHEHEEDEEEEEGEGDEMDPLHTTRGSEAKQVRFDKDSGYAKMERMGFQDPPFGGAGAGKWKDLRSLLLESTPSLLLSLIGLVFTGELLEHLARWRVFRRVDELFILVPMIGNLKGNLEMCLSARLGTSANIGELDERRTRRTMLVANMTLLGLQALLISCLAAVLSFGLGLVTEHRLGDSPPAAASGVGGGGIGGAGTGTGVEGIVNATLLSASRSFQRAAAGMGMGRRAGEQQDAGLAVGEVEWHEGYTRPGFKQLVMVLATGMGAAGISSAVLGSFMGSLIVLSRWAGLDPDNITPPVAACLGDLLTLFILALLGSLLVGTMDTVIPLLAVIAMSIAAGWFTRRVMRNEWIKDVARGSWLPLIGAMLISSGTGMVLDKGVAKYRGFALLAISMTGLTGSIGAIHANRLSTQLHTQIHPHQHSQRSTSNGQLLENSHTHVHAHAGLTPLQSSITLYLVSFPCQAAFILFVNWAGWIDLSLSWAGWGAFACATFISLSLAHFLTLFFWSKSLDPDSYTLPIHSALVDFIGQLLLMLAYEICIYEGRDVVVRDP